ncbi:hypothetical protein [Rhodoferax sp.]|uniref:hypothetical protein n=1 Tax=Rhodoferax sp. TaxID=50421 RepID=UPI00262B831E|nr:hypothetical protein [Rhodoferax sp.]MDD2810819.1 hypothetical protein [Rhodoferax sp.]MDD5480131.1 hypothetical protein [Rhodoferax sp.]
MRKIVEAGAAHGKTNKITASHTLLSLFFVVFWGLNVRCLQVDRSFSLFEDLL